MIKTLSFRKDIMEQAAGGGFTNATDVADYLVKKGMPFREAHAVSGKVVLYCVKAEKAILDLTLEELKEFSEMFEEDVYEAASLLACVNLRKVPGGPAPEMVQASIESAEAFLNNAK